MAMRLAITVQTPYLFACCLGQCPHCRLDDVNIVPTFVLTPLTYLGGVFYSLDLLPDFWSGVSQVNPLVYVVNAFRYGMLGVSDVDITVSFGMLIGLTIVTFAYAMHLLQTGTRLRT